MTHRSSGPEAKTVEYLKSKEKKPTLPEESVALQGLVFYPIPRKALFVGPYRTIFTPSNAHAHM